MQVSSCSWSYRIGQLEQLPRIAEIDSRVQRSYVGLNFFNLPRKHHNTLLSAHAALSPWEGKNALDAAVLGYINISALRQQLKPTHRVHGIFEGKDWAPNSRSIERFPFHLSNFFLFFCQSFLITPSSCQLFFVWYAININHMHRCYVRAPTRSEMQETVKRVTPCFE